MLSTCMAFWYTETKHVICFVILCLIRCPFHMHWYVHLVLIPSFLSASKQKQQKHQIHLPCSNWSEYSPNGSNVKIPLYCSIFGRDKRRLISGLPCIPFTIAWAWPRVKGCENWVRVSHRKVTSLLSCVKLSTSVKINKWINKPTNVKSKCAWFASQSQRILCLSHTAKLAMSVESDCPPER